MDLTTYAIPAFVLLLVVEILAYRFAPDDDQRGYTAKDTATSLSMGLGSIAANLGWGLLAALAWVAGHHVTPLDVPGTWWGWALAVLAVDFFYYWEHRAMHEIRLLWASHVVHHSAGTTTCPRRCGRAGPARTTWSSCCRSRCSGSSRRWCSRRTRST